MVASISASHSAQYYLDAVDHALYYLTGELGIGEWYGAGAEALGFRGDIRPNQLIAAYEGFNPNGTIRLVQQQIGKQRQPAWDITLSAPKSVSVLWSVLGPERRHRVESLVLQAAKTTLDYHDSEALITRRGKNGHLLEHAKGVYAVCPHGTSRAQDPQLHIHCLAINLCLRSDGTTGTIRSSDIYEHKMALGALFRLELADLLQKELGLSVSRDSWKFKIDGVPEALCDEQSKRRHIIESIAKEEGWHSPRVLAELAITTRTAKGLVPLKNCFEHWQATGDKFGFTRQAAEHLLAQGTERKLQTQSAQSLTTVNAATVDKAFTNAVAELAAFHAYFPERDIIRHAATLAQAKGVSATDLIAGVKQGLSRFENRVEVESSIYKYYTTKENVAAEKELIERATAGQSSDKHLVTQQSVTKAKARVERQLSRKLGAAVTLTEDQLRSLRHVTEEPGDLKIIQGYAGTGKTQMLQAAYLAWKESGYHVLGTALTGRAALGLEKTTDIPSVTVAGLLRALLPHLTTKEYAQLVAWKSIAAIKAIYYESIEAGNWLRNPWKQALREVARTISGYGKAPIAKKPDCKLTRQTILVVDEAAMIPTKALLAMKRECDRAGAKLVVVGDRLQLPPIEAGGPFWSLAKRIGYQSLTTIVRQKQEWMKEALMELIDHGPQRALELYAANQALHLERHQNAAIEKLVADYRQLKPKELPSAMVLTTTNAEAFRLNQAIQSKRKAASELGFGSLRLANGQRVFKHDRILFTLNDYKLGVRNGLFGTVIKINRPRGIMGPGSLTIVLDAQQPRGWFSRKPQTITIDLKKYPQIRLGYAATTHKVQGITVAKSFVLLGDSMLSKEMAFTQLSRATDSTTLYGTHAQYGDSVRLLATQISKTTQKDLAHDHTLQVQRTRNDNVLQL
jgi:conjugative relaxase-like TrwC/TraI family protein